MKKTVLVILFVILYGIFFPKNIYAIYDPSSYPNNRFGIHVADINDLESATRLVNSSGGDWGYVTVVIAQDDRDQKKWQMVFDKMRLLHIIPIVRIASVSQNGIWLKPDKSDVDNWVLFLDSLNWVIQNRYIVIGNEPNHAKEWGGKINPEEYAEYLKLISIKLKEANSDYFILNAGFDASAPDSRITMSQEKFLERMYRYDNEIFDILDGWTSHSYPNPSFSGSPEDEGKGTVRTFDWEQNLLKKYTSKKLPIFITETGWAHNQDGDVPGLIDSKTVGDNLIYAFNNVWNKEDIIAVTPFLLNYKDKPFDIFSWFKDTGEFYSFYDDVRSIPKTKGAPKQKISGRILSIIYPVRVKLGKEITFIASVENNGQDIWESGELRLNSSANCLTSNFTNRSIILPGVSTDIYFKGKLTRNPKDNPCVVSLSKNSEIISSSFVLNITTESVEPAKNYSKLTIFQLVKCKLIYFISIFTKNANTAYIC